ncbi:hypothetical protein HDU93_003984 [Gonapodya sp. JEL0774]|nr:hypothetical protein HDU93_003984 [Gonapodya sp. JEL0774]
MSTLEEHNITGTVAPGFETVRDAFLKNFRDGAEIGAGYVAYYKGEKVVDLVGGWANSEKTRPLTAENVFVVHSSGKALMGMSILRAISQGKLSLDTKIASIWPEFAEGSKEDVTVKDLLEHQGGVAWLDSDHRPSLAELRDLDALAKRIASQPHNFDGILTKAYHAVTRGWFLNEILRRTTGASQGQCIAELASTLGVKVYVGLPESADNYYVPVIWGPGARAGIGFAHSLGPDHPHFKSLVNSSVTDVPFPEENVLHSNVVEVLRGEVPTDVRQLAAFANVMAMGGSFGGVDIADAVTFAEAHTLEQRNLDQIDAVLMGPIRTTHGGFGSSQPSTKIPNIRLDMSTKPPTPTIPEEYKAVGYAPTFLNMGSGSSDERCARLNLAFANAVEKLDHKGGQREVEGDTSRINELMTERLRGKGEGNAFG